MTLVIVESAAAASASAAASDTGSAANAQNVERSLQPKAVPLAGGILTKAANSHSGVLAASLEKTAEALRADPRLHDLLARHRVDLAGVGAAALVAVALLFLL